MGAQQGSREGSAVGLRKVLVATSILGLVLLGMTASASANNRTCVYLGAGLTTGLPVLGVEHKMQNGFAIGAAIGGFPLPAVGGLAVFVESTANAKYYFDLGDVDPYVSVFGGVISLILKGLHPIGSVAGCAVGVEMIVSRLRLAAELGYTAAFVEDERMGAVRFGGSLGFCF
jgi:hypothetical protein